MKVSIINFNSGNLFSIKKSIKDLRHDAFICYDSDDLSKSDKIILPGVGSYHNAMIYLTKFGFIDELNDLVLKKGVHILGICLGMQLFCNSSNEKSFTKGLSYIDADVVSLEEMGCNFKLPHVGWNNICIKKKHKILENIQDNSDFYFVHNYGIKCNEKNSILTTSSYGVDFVSMFYKNNIFGSQFHPEKSSLIGSKLIENFLKL